LSELWRAGHAGEEVLSRLRHATVRRARVGRNTLRRSSQLCSPAPRRADPAFQGRLGSRTQTLIALRITLRLAKQLAFLSNAGDQALCQDLVEFGRMLMDSSFVEYYVAGMTRAVKE
jgi:hypothetical protein